MPSDDLKPPQEGVGDDYHKLARTIITSIPLIGGAAVELFNTVVAPPIVERRNEWMNDVAERLQKLAEEKKLDLDDLREQPIFIDAVLQATQAAIRTHQLTKRNALRNAVLNSALPGSPDASTQLMFINFIDRFTEWHLRILGLFRDPKRWATENKVDMQEFSMGTLNQVFLSAFPALTNKEPFYRQVFADLNSTGLLETPALMTMMTGQGSFSKRTTAFGDQFLRFITES